MRTITLCVLLLIVSSCINHLYAQDYKLAMGVRFSSASPTLSNSVSVKYFLDESNAVEGLISFGTRFGLGGLYERHQLIGGTPAFTWFWGIGGLVGRHIKHNLLRPNGRTESHCISANGPPHAFIRL